MTTGYLSPDFAPDATLLPLATQSLSFFGGLYRLQSGRWGNQLNALREVESILSLHSLQVTIVIGLPVPDRPTVCFSNIAWLYV